MHVVCRESTQYPTRESKTKRKTKTKRERERERERESGKKRGDYPVGSTHDSARTRE